MKYILILIVVSTIAFFSFDHKCEHIYVATEKPEVVYNNCVGFGIQLYGVQEGQELVCVKCFNLIRQKVIIHQSQPYSLLPDIIDTMKSISGNSGGNLLINIKGDSLILKSALK